jgi:hypothetical protein
LPLSPAKLRFAQEYAENGGKGAAAVYRSAKVFSASSAGSMAVQWLKDPEVAAEIHAIRQGLGARHGLNADNILGEVRRLALSDARNLFREDGTLKLPGEWDSATAAAVHKVKTEERFEPSIGPDGEVVQVRVVTREVVLWDKPKALALCMEYLGLTHRPSLDSILVFLPPAFGALIREAVARHARAGKSAPSLEGAPSEGQTVVVTGTVSEPSEVSANVGPGPGDRSTSGGPENAG